MRDNPLNNNILDRFIGRCVIPSFLLATSFLGGRILSAEFSEKDESRDISAPQDVGGYTGVTSHNVDWDVIFASLPASQPAPETIPDLTPAPRDYFDGICDLVIDCEGGYVFDPRDPGGETKFGISKRAYPKLDIKNLTRAQAKEIYAQDYWKKHHIDQLPHPISAFVFDMAVNQGPKTAILCLQGCLGVKQDGICGKATQQAAREQHGRALLDRLAASRLERYHNTKNADIYLLGWKNRMHKILDYCKGYFCLIKNEVLRLSQR